MFDRIDWNAVLTVVGNTVLVSIPEETFFVLFCLLLINQFDFLNYKSPKGRKFQKYDILLLSIPILTAAIGSNILRFSGLNLILVPVFSMLICYVAIVITYRLYYNLHDIFKSFICLLFAFIILMLIETLYMPAILYMTNSTIKDINSSLLLNFVCSLPAKGIQLIIILYLFFKKSSILKTNIFEIIMSNKIVRVVTLCLLLFNFALTLALTNLITIRKVLISLPINTQVYIIVSMILFPMINLTAYISCIYYKSNKEAQDRYLVYLYIQDYLDNIKRISKSDKTEVLEKAVLDIESYTKDALLSK